MFRGRECLVDLKPESRKLGSYPHSAVGANDPVVELQNDLLHRREVSALEQVAFGAFRIDDQ
jgi:hypothetical protein